VGFAGKGGEGRAWQPSLLVSFRELEHFCFQLYGERV
jgi:hypothetical protein